MGEQAGFFGQQTVENKAFKFVLRGKPSIFVSNDAYTLWFDLGCNILVKQR